MPKNVYLHLRPWVLRNRTRVGEIKWSGFLLLHPTSLSPTSNCRSQKDKTGNNGNGRGGPGISVKRIFGRGLDEILAGSTEEVPETISRCSKFIEVHGVAADGIYRISGVTSNIKRLKWENKDNKRILHYVTSTKRRNHKSFDFLLFWIRNGQKEFFPIIIIIIKSETIKMFYFLLINVWERREKLSLSHY